MQRLVIAMTAAALAVAAAGCGQGAARDDARAVTERFYAAAAAGDGALACAQLASATRSSLVQQERAPCPQAVGELELGEGGVERVQVAITAAQVALRDGEVAFLDEGPDGWRLSAVGCRFEDGDPRSHPATCEAEA
ncbi:hypothetical protein [Conexibacter arvalis]|uniref:Lipoprotein n=1 Tax=Conexibacter arvalis TaxID=912552 RepID=A0A840IDM3_9ACTN|nr:hypothetical protein [Conexibacter arvalis]MBB4662351.1 hypothetical protein [Conexibacter arvalis]